MKKHLMPLATAGVLLTSVVAAGPEQDEDPAAAAAAGTAEEAKAEPSPAATPETIKAVQQALRGKGYEPGPIDGVMGPKTEAALRAFQSAEGLKETGRLDFATLAELGVTPSSPPI
jgi:peptidoglycan hydrolase-like protein with peptidoglycan-binding domain